MTSKNNTVSSYKGDTSLATEAALVLGTKEVAVEQTPKANYNETVKLQSLKDANISYTGRVSGKSYSWNGAGSVQAVDALDAPYLLDKRIKTQSCCNVSDTAIFQQID